MKTLIVEDSRLAREGLIRQLQEFPVIDIVGQAENVDEALILVERYQPALIFLDINMPERDGFELLTELVECPKIIFTTAYSEYAIRSFDFNTVDYLLKPITPERLSRAIAKVSSGVPAPAVAQPVCEQLDENSQIFVKDKRCSYLVALAKITHFESCGNHTRVFFDGASPFVYKSLSSVERRLPPSLFFRISRQHIINLTCITALEDAVGSGLEVRLNDGSTLSVSRSSTSKLRNLFSL